MNGCDMQADKGKCCKHFAPSFPETGDAQVDSSLTKASELNMAFAFQKTGDSAAVARATPGDRPRISCIHINSPYKWRWDHIPSSDLSSQAQFCMSIRGVEQ